MSDIKNISLIKSVASKAAAENNKEVNVFEAKDIKDIDGVRDLLEGGHYVDSDEEELPDDEDDVDFDDEEDEDHEDDGEVDLKDTRVAAYFDPTRFDDFVDALVDEMEDEGVSFEDAMNTVFDETKVPQGLCRKKLKDAVCEKTGKEIDE